MPADQSANSKRKLVKSKPPMDILTFCDEVLKLRLKLWKKQREILTQVFSPNVQIVLMLLGRRSGKSFMSAICAVYAAVIYGKKYREKLRPGEYFRILLVAPTEAQAQALLVTIRELLYDSPHLKSWVRKDLSKMIALKNGAIFQVASSSSRSLRGAAVPFLILDEFAHFLDSSGNSSGDAVLDAVRPAMAQFGNDGRMFLPSTPWAKRGAFYDIYKCGISEDPNKIRVFEYKTRDVNETIAEEWYQHELAIRPESYFTEYECKWVDDVFSFINSSAIDRVINHDRYELDAVDNERIIIRNPSKVAYYSKISEYLTVWKRGGYYLSLDPAKGHRDAYTAAIAHYEYRRGDGEEITPVFVVDLWHQFKATFVSGSRTFVNIEDVHAWIIEQDKKYRFESIVLDQYQSLSTIQSLTNKVRRIDELTWTRPTKQEAFSKLRDLIYSGRIELYNHPVAINQLKNLVVKLTADGGWTVTGGEGVAVDDFVSALAGAVYVAEEPRLMMQNSMAIWSR